MVRTTRGSKHSEKQRNENIKERDVVRPCVGILILLQSIKNIAQEQLTPYYFLSTLHLGFVSKLWRHQHSQNIEQLHLHY